MLLGDLPRRWKFTLGSLANTFFLFPSLSCLNMRAWGRFWKFAISEWPIARGMETFFARSTESVFAWDRERSWVSLENPAREKARWRYRCWGYSAGTPLLPRALFCFMAGIFSKWSPVSFRPFAARTSR